MHFNRRLFQLLFNAVKGVVDDALGYGFLTIDHEVVHELGQDDIAKLCVWQYFAFFSGVTT